MSFIYNDLVTKYLLGEKKGFANGLSLSKIQDEPKAGCSARRIQVRNEALFFTGNDPGRVINHWLWWMFCQ